MNVNFICKQLRVHLILIEELKTWRSWRWV